MKLKSINNATLQEVWALYLNGSVAARARAHGLILEAHLNNNGATTTAHHIAPAGVGDAYTDNGEEIECKVNEGHHFTESHIRNCGAVYVMAVDTKTLTRLAQSNERTAYASFCSVIARAVVASFNPEEFLTLPAIPNEKGRLKTVIGNAGTDKATGEPAKRIMFKVSASDNTPRAEWIEFLKNHK